jgi:hypothetical protein
MKEDLEKMTKQTEVSLRATTQICFKSFNAYDTMTQTSNGKNATKQKDLRKAFFDHFGITNEVEAIIGGGKVQAVCSLTGRFGSKKVKLAHLVPASVKEDIRDTLRLTEEDIWSFRNVILLSENLEMCYDRNQLSFEPVPLYCNRFRMKIWDEGIKGKLIWENAEVVKTDGDNTIGYYEGKELNLSMSIDKCMKPFKRCLSYQNFICFFRSKLSTKETPEDFSSDLGNPDNWKIKRDDFMMMRLALEKATESEYFEDKEADTDDKESIF